ncbi:MAG TPA: cupin domain-containing protein [Gemmatimonadota bacterium]|nr:cupin domain-containing protein [Gemmatimonadota bacterium]
MKHWNIPAALAAVVLLATAPALAQEYEKPAEEAATATAEATHIVVEPGDIDWQPAPPILPAGANMAVLAGDLAKEGPFVFRVRVPDGYQVAPHFHPGTESVTVISGTFGIGMGEAFDESALRDLGPGALIVIPAESPHFVRVKGETEIQVHGIGPWALTYVNPADDPSQTAPAEGAPTGR